MCKPYAAKQMKSKQILQREYFMQKVKAFGPLANRAARSAEVWEDDRSSEQSEPKSWRLSACDCSNYWAEIRSDLGTS